MSQNTKAIPPSPEQVDAFLDWLGPKRLSQIPDNPDIMFNSFGFIRMLMATTSRIERMEAKQKEKMPLKHVVMKTFPVGFILGSVFEQWRRFEEEQEKNISTSKSVGSSRKRRGK